MDASAAALGPAERGPIVHRRSPDRQVAAQGGANVVRPALSAFLRRAFLPSLLVFFLLLHAGTAGAQAATATPPGTLLRNVASVEYGLASGVRETVESNAVSLTVAPAPSRATVAILRASPQGPGAPSTSGPTQCRRTDGFATLPPPVLANGATIDPAVAVPLDATAFVHGGEAVFFRLVDADQNRDASVADNVDLELTSAAGDHERLRLTETGPSTGEFVGYVQTSAGPAVAGDCVLQVLRDAELGVSYVDPADAQDGAAADALVDPFGRVFDARTGAPVDGVRVRLVQATTGQPAVVVGDDGVSAYPAEIVTGTPVTDAGGTVYTFPPGVFRFPLVAPGAYRLEIVPGPGHTHPSTATPEQIAALPGAPYRIGPGSYGNAFEVTGPLATVVDVPLDPAGTSLFLSKSTTTAVAAAGDFVRYTLVVENASTSGAFASVVTTDRLPRGMRYRPGSTRLDGDRAPDPVVDADGQTLRFTTGSLAPGARASLSYVAEVTVAARGDELVNVAQAAAGSVRSNEARASIRLREELNRSEAIIVGRVHRGGCDEAAGGAGVAGVRVYLEDGRYSVTDAEGKYHFEGVPAGSHVVQLDTITVPDTLEVALCDGRVRHAGRAFSQFVDLRGGALWRADFVLRERSPAEGATTAPAPQATAAATAAQASPPDTSSAPAATREPELSVERLAPGIAMLRPAEGSLPAIPSIKVAVQHAPGDEVRLTVNGRAVSRLNFDGVQVNAAKTVALSQWRGVDLADGDNVVVAQVRAADGSVRQEIRRDVHFGGGAVRAELDRERSVLTADGRTRPVIALRMVDAYGKPARAGTLGGWRVEAPYRSWWEVESLNENAALAVGDREPTFRVDAEGVARLELEPTTQSGTAVLRLRFNDRQQQEIRVWLEPEARDWILVGIAEGSAAYRTLEDNIEAAEDAGLAEGFDDDGRVAFFAKGRIKGEFLLTVAYDSARDPDKARERLHGVIEPDRYYTLYGDATEQRFEAASAEKLFLKIERRQFYAMFGDFDTGLTVTELSRYSRSMTGLKGEFGGERVGVTAFAADAETGFVKDELRGDGTSGLYRLSSGGIVINSDKLRIEVRDRFRSEIVIESRPLARFLDYSIDYDRGTLFFRQPVPSRDDQFNPVWIVAEYEVLDGGDGRTTAGGRVATRVAGDRVEVGASYLQEGSTDGPTRLAGTDLRVRLGAATELRAEAAHSTSDDPSRPASANAYLAEVEHVTERLDARVYLREQDSGFGLGQQLTTEDGTRKAGVDARVKFAETYSAVTELFTIENLDTGAERFHASAELRQEAAGYSYGAGLRHVEDSGTASGDQRSDQAFVRGSVDLLDDRVTLRAGSDFTLGGRDASADYPARSTVGLDYRVSPDATLFAEYEHAAGQDIDADMTRVGVRATPWERAQLTSSLNQEFTEFGPRVFANVGLTQGWQVNERLALDVGFDQTDTVLGSGFEPFDPDVPLASGSLDEDFFATYFGALYRTASWTANARVENRDADSERRWSVTSGLYREPVAGHAFSALLRWLASDFTGGVTATEADIDLGWAYRPVSSRWIVLNRLELGLLERDETTGRERAERIVNNLNANWQVDPRTQFGVQFGARYVVSTFDDERYAGLSTLYGLDLRRDVTSRIDLGLHGTWLESWEAGVGELAVGADVGVTVARNVWVSVGYNFTGFDDDDFGASRYTAQGPYVKLRIKADQDTFKDVLSIARFSPGTAR